MKAWCILYILAFKNTHTHATMCCKQGCRHVWERETRKWRKSWPLGLLKSVVLLACMRIRYKSGFTLGPVGQVYISFFYNMLQFRKHLKRKEMVKIKELRTIRNIGHQKIELVRPRTCYLSRAIWPFFATLPFGHVSWYLHFHGLFLLF